MSASAASSAAASSAGAHADGSPAAASFAAPMERLGFLLPDFVRVSWASDVARGVWEGRIQRILHAWQEIEWRAVAAGVRSCGITTVAPEHLAARAALFAEHGLVLLPLEIERLASHEGAPGGGAGADATGAAGAAAALRLGEPAIVRGAVGTPEAIAFFAAAWEAGDNDRLSDLMGVPSCCREFLLRLATEEGMVDATWPWAAGALPATAATAATAGAADPAPAARREADLISLDLPPEANLLWRWAGVRAMPHQPCRADCPASLDLARRCLEIGRAAGFEEEVGWMLDILSWPAEWSALHGVAEIKTPVLRVSTRTDATARKYAVRWLGEAYPAEGAQGLRFPYQGPSKPIMSTSRGQRRALAHAGSLPDVMPDWYHEENGFTTRNAMDAAHRPLVEAVDRVLAPRDGVGAVLDLGCGNGALLKKLRDLHPSVVPFGIDLDPGRVKRAAFFFPHERDHFVAGDLADPASPVWGEGRRYAVALLMPGRLIEAGPEGGARLRGLVEAHADAIVAYGYGDWLERHGGLAALLAAAGMEPLEEVGRRGAVRARFIGAGS